MLKQSQSQECKLWNFVSRYQLKLIRLGCHWSMVINYH